MLSVCVAIVVIAVPGLLTGLAAGVRGWALAGLAPLLSYAIGGLTGPWTAAVGWSFTPVTYAVSTVVFVAIAYGVRKLTVRRWAPEPEPGLWDRRGHLAVGACLLFGAAVGGYATLRGLGHIGALPQGFDAVYHGNAVRYIADTGDGSLFGTGHVNWYGDAAPVFYPNAYHLLAAVTNRLSGASIPATLDANTLLLPGLLALSLVTLVREFRGRAVLAGAVALTAVAPVMGVYESMDRGPLLPFALGVTLTPLAAVALRRYLERVAPDTGFVLLLAAVGLLCIHSSTLFGGILFAGPVLVQRWLEGPRRIGRDLLALLPIAVVSFLVAWLQLFGALGLATSDLPYYGWPSEWRASTALGALLGFQHFEAHPQVWLSVALFLGIVFFARAGALRWIGLTAGVTGLAYMAVASSNAPAGDGVVPAVVGRPRTGSSRWRRSRCACSPHTAWPRPGVAARPAARPRTGGGDRGGGAAGFHGVDERPVLPVERRPRVHGLPGRGPVEAARDTGRGNSDRRSWASWPPRASGR